MAARKKVIVIVIDGLTPGVLERGIEQGVTPAVAFLAEHGRYGRAVSTFPSLTPVCLSSIATGAHPDVHEIPHLVWYDRSARRLVEYGSSFGAVRAAGMRRSILNTIFNMNELHLSRRAVTVYEAVEDAGLTAAAINMTCYRGRNPHLPTVPGLTRAAYGPRRFFYYSLFQSDVIGAPLAVRNRSAGTIDGYAAAAGRWLVTRDGFDLLVYYLSDFDYSSHVLGPEGAGDALRRVDKAVGTLIAAAGSPDEFLERYAVLLCSDHGQTLVERAIRLEDSFAGVRGAVVTASNRAGMVYRLAECPLDVRALAERLDEEPAAEAVLFLEGGEAVVRREREELRFARTEEGWRTSGDASLLEYPNGLERVWRALGSANAGDVLVSPAAGVEFTDLAGRHHAGGGSHGSLARGDSDVPVLTVGMEGEVRSITDVAPLALAHLGIERPAHSQELAGAA